jgi:hypothetical protein
MSCTNIYRCDIEIVIRYSNVANINMVGSIFIYMHFLGMKLNRSTHATYEINKWDVDQNCICIFDNKESIYDIHSFISYSFIEHASANPIG